MHLAVTTAQRASPAAVAAARDAAGRRGLPFLPRGGLALARLAEAAGAAALLVLTDGAAVLWTAGVEHRWSPGMGLLRMRRALATRGRPAGPGDRDPFLEAAAIGPGDEVLDATLGLGADALVAAAACGPTGRVVALEASAPLAAWVGEGLRRLGVEPAGRIEVRAGDHRALLAALPPRSFDVVTFDPMFRHPRREPGGFDAVRRLAEPAPLAPETLASARRVARRWVLVKDGAPGWDLARLGLTPLPSARGAHRYFGRAAPLA